MQEEEVFSQHSCLTDSSAARTTEERRQRQERRKDDGLYSTPVPVSTTQGGVSI